MELASVRALKEEVTAQVVQPAVAAAQSVGRFGVRARSLTRADGATRAMALGVAGEGKDCKLAVRLQRRSLEEDQALIAAITERAKGEVDVRYIGRVLASEEETSPSGSGGVAAQATPWRQKKQRPMLIGASIAHYAVTAGTLGCFARTQDDRLVILSNNHVLAIENAGQPGDNILQPGPYDGGTAQDRVGGLLAFEPLSKTGPNLIDAAISTIDDGIAFDRATLKGLGTLRGLRQAPLSLGDRVAKVGRTTGVTHGRVTVVELDGLVVGYDMGNLLFDDQIEIEGAGPRAFSAGGDSGSVIVDEDFRACALLFAGGDTGGSNDMGLTFANPLPLVLQTLNLRLAV